MCLVLFLDVCGWNTGVSNVGWCGMLVLGWICRMWACLMLLCAECDCRELWACVGWVCGVWGGAVSDILPCLQVVGIKWFQNGWFMSKAKSHPYGHVVNKVFSNHVFEARNIIIVKYSLRVSQSSKVRRAAMGQHVVIRMSWECLRELPKSTTIWK